MIYYNIYNPDKKINFGIAFYSTRINKYNINKKRF